MEPYIKQATTQLAPAYTQKTQAQQARIPALQKLYGTLIGNLGGQQKQATQNLWESMAGRGILRSSIGTTGAVGVANEYAQKRSDYASQQAKEIGDVQQSIASTNIDRANAISQLADTLYQRQQAENQYKQQQQYNQQQLRTQRDYNAQQSREAAARHKQTIAQQKAIADRQYKLSKQAARR